MTNDDMRCDVVFSGNMSHSHITKILFFNLVRDEYLEHTPSSHSSTFPIFHATMKSFASLAALVLVSASEDTFSDDGLSLLQLRATTQGTVDNQQSPVLCSIIVDTSSQVNAQTGGGGQGQFLVDGALTEKQWFQKPIAQNQQVNTPPEELMCAPTSVRVIAGSGDGWGYKKVSIDCNGQVQVLLDSPNGEAYGGAPISQKYWVDQPGSAVSAFNDYALTGPIAGLGVCGAPPTTPPPAPAPDSASAVGDPHLTTNSGQKSDMCCTNGVCTKC